MLRANLFSVVFAELNPDELDRRKQCIRDYIREKLPLGFFNEVRGLREQRYGRPVIYVSHASDRDQIRSVVPCLRIEDPQNPGRRIPFLVDVSETGMLATAGGPGLSADFVSSSSVEIHELSLSERWNRIRHKISNQYQSLFEEALLKGDLTAVLNVSFAMRDLTSRFQAILTELDLEPDEDRQAVETEIMSGILNPRLRLFLAGNQSQIVLDWKSIDKGFSMIGTPRLTDMTLRAPLGLLIELMEFDEVEQVKAAEFCSGALERKIRRPS